MTALENGFPPPTWEKTPQFIITEHSTVLQPPSTVRNLNLTHSIEEVVILESSEVDRDTVMIRFTKEASFAFNRFRRPEHYYEISYRGVITVVDENNLSLTRMVTDQEVENLRHMCRRWR